MKKLIIITTMILFPVAITVPTDDSAVARSARRHGLHPCLVKAVIHKESKGNSKAKTYERRVRDWSYGAMQIRWRTATKELGFRGTKEQLLNLEVNVDLGSKYLAKKLKRYGTIEKAVAAYNAGSVGKVIKNKKYVNDVMRLYETCSLY